MARRAGQARYSARRRSQTCTHYSRRLRVEPLEPRRLLATVDTLLDVVDAGDGLTSLREAIAAATPGDTIDFAVTGTIQLSNLGQLVINKDLSIEGPEAEQLTIRAFDPGPALGNGSRIFFIDDGNVAAAKNVSIRGLTLTGGDSNDSGGAIFNSENLTLTASVVTGNRAAINGGGIYDSYGSVAVIDSTISDNTAANDGGGLFKIRGIVSSFLRSTVSGNDANIGGGMFSRLGDFSINDSTVSGNMAVADGGGLYTQESEINVENSTFSGNSAARGGALCVRNSDLVLTSSTITDNSAITAAGLYATSGSVTFGGSIIAGNVGQNYVLQPNVADSSLGYNLVGTGTGPAPFGANDQTGVADPMLGPLANNAGPTLTHSPLEGSPAVDRGNPNAAANGGPVFDQRDEPFVRVYDGDGNGETRIDIGAVELQPLPPAFYGDYNGDQHADAGDYTRWRNTLGSTVGKYSDADGSGNGIIDLKDYRHWKENYGTEVPTGGGGLARAVATHDDAAAAVNESSSTSTDEQLRVFPAVLHRSGEFPARPPFGVSRPMQPQMRLQVAQQHLLAVRLLAVANDGRVPATIIDDLDAAAYGPADARDTAFAQLAEELPSLRIAA